jgi:MFS family permease
MFVAMGTGGLFVASTTGTLVRSWGMAGVLTTAAALGLVANAASRPFWGWVSDRRGRENTMVVAFILQAFCLVSVVTLGRTSPVMFTITLILTYFTWGEIYSLFPSTVGDYFGSKYATSNNAFLYSSKGVAALIGVYLPALLFEQFGSWTAVFYGSAVLALLSGLTALFLRAKPLPKRVSQQTLVSASGTVIR